MKLDRLLHESLPVRALNAETRARVLDAARHELRAGRRVPRWYWHVAMIVGSTLGVVALAGAVLLAAGQTAAAVVAAHAVQLAFLVSASLGCGVAAFGPRLRAGAIAIAASLAAAICLVALRADPAVASASPGWLCLVSHLAAGALPLGVALHVLRDCAPSLTKAVIAGFAAGSTGAMLGEIGCEQGPLHIAVWHLGAWAVVAAAVVVISRRLTPRSYAP